MVLSTHHIIRTLNCPVHEENLRKIQYLPKDASYGITKFSDMTDEEFKAKYLSDYHSKSWQYQKYRNGTKLGSFPEKMKQMKIPQKYDWRNINNQSFVSPIKNQENCGGCWAFCTVETLESVSGYKRKTKPPVLSVQQVIDCANNNYGCEGGDICTAVDWMEKSSVHILTEEQYPLTLKSGSCRIPSQNKGVQVSSYTCENLTGKESTVLDHLYNIGPVSVAVDATTWKNYMGGIIKWHCGTDRNHAVQIIGYDISGDVPYYIVRNSWGQDFGVDGYLYIKVGDNLCGIAAEVTTIQVV
ncbi:hypothetical protein ScPMuIL_010144 [Solemya velum]